MPHRREANTAAEHHGRDPFLALPDTVVQHMLGFLPARDAARTCVLARRWRLLWRSAPRLRIADVASLRHVGTLNRLVNRALLLRDPGTVLDECEIDLRGFWDLDGACVDIWIRHCLTCRVRVLQVRTDERVELSDWPLFSQRLVRLELQGLEMGESFLDFSGCPVLEDLKVTNCLLAADRVLSGSLKHLRITGCGFCWQFVPTHISARSLISLQLDDYVGVTPILETMPSLETASVKLGQNNESYCNFCDNGGTGECTCDMYNVDGSRNDVCFLPRGLSSVAYLELNASSEMVTFRRDLRCCPTFINLKTLVLKDWCLVADLHMLFCFLQYTPILEKLVLQLCKSILFAIETQSRSPNERQQSYGTVRQLKTVEVRCPIINGSVHNVLKVLRS